MWPRGWTPDNVVLVKAWDDMLRVNIPVRIVIKGEQLTYTADLSETRVTNVAGTYFFKR